MKIEYVLPQDIEKRSFEIISEEIKKRGIILDPVNAPVIMRIIHTTADFDYVRNLKFSENAVETGISALKSGALIITDTNMALAGINKTALGKLGCSARCFMADEDVARAAAEKGITRAAASAEKAAEIKDRPLIMVSGNAPTFLIRLRELADMGKISPALIIAMPVGFVNVIVSKEMTAASGVPYIAAMGRKGGSNVAAAAVNALLYCITRK